jgi:hypothetical protein
MGRAAQRLRLKKLERRAAERAAALGDRWAACGFDRYGERVHDMMPDLSDESYAKAKHIADKTTGRGGTVGVVRLRYNGPKATYDPVPDGR